VPFARAGAGFTADLESLVAWLATKMDTTAVTRLVRVSWITVGTICERVSAAELDPRRLDGLFEIGLDEVSWRKHHRYLSLVSDHRRGKFVWGAEGRDAGTADAFFDELGPERAAQLAAVSMDMSAGYEKSVRAAGHAPQALICFDPFHLVSWANQAVDSVFQRVDRRSSELTGRDWRTARYALRAGAERLGDRHHQLLAAIERDRHELFQAWELKEEFRALFQSVEPDDAASYLRDWIERCVASGLAAMTSLARKIDRNFDGIVNTVRLGLSNSRLEGINAKIRLIMQRFGGRQCYHDHEPQGEAGRDSDA